jgi:hypothetical protein
VSSLQEYPADARNVGLGAVVTGVLSAVVGSLRGATPGLITAAVGVLLIVGVEMRRWQSPRFSVTEREIERMEDDYSEPTLEISGIVDYRKVSMLWIDVHNDGQLGVFSADLANVRPVKEIDGKPIPPDGYTNNEVAWEPVADRTCSIGPGKTARIMFAANACNPDTGECVIWFWTAYSPIWGKNLGTPRQLKGWRLYPQDRTVEFDLTVVDEQHPNRKITRHGRIVFSKNGRVKKMLLTQTPSRRHRPRIPGRSQAER